jgi:hypothetical protein
MKENMGRRWYDSIDFESHIAALRAANSEDPRGDAFNKAVDKLHADCQAAKTKAQLEDLVTTKM